MELEPLPESTSADVCIVGAGIAGLSVAYELTRMGQTVVVLDDGAIGRGMTGRTTAHIVNALDDRYYDLADRIVKLEYGRVVSDRVLPVGAGTPEGRGAAREQAVEA